MTPKERAAMQQALKAMEDASPHGLTFKEAITALREQLAKQPKQKPVGMVIGGVFEPCNDDVLSGAWELYAAPVRTKDLTDDEIDKLHSLDKFWDAHADDIFRYIDFARAVIAADRENNK